VNVLQHLRSTGAVPVMGYLKKDLSSEDCNWPQKLDHVLR
jgi:hypothetical protein